MKTAQMIAAALILTASVSAMAQQATTTQAPAATQESKEIVRGKTRAEVLAELQQAQSEGKAMPSSFVAFDAPAKTDSASGNTTVARK